MARFGWVTDPSARKFGVKSGDPALLSCPEIDHLIVFRTRGRSGFRHLGDGSARQRFRLGDVALARSARPVRDTPWPTRRQNVNPNIILLRNCKVYANIIF